jgi:hypothetical protein
MTSKQEKYDTLAAIASLGSDDEPYEEMLFRVHGARKAVAERRNTPKLPSSYDDPNTQTANGEGSILAGSHTASEAQNALDPATQLAGAKIDSDTQIRLAPAFNFSDHGRTDTQKTSVAEPNFGDHSRGNAQKSSVAEPNSVNDQDHTDAHPSGVVDGPLSAGSQRSPDSQGSFAPGGFLRDPVLGVLADVVDDLERVRIANENRVRQLTRTETDKDGKERGFGLTLDHPEVAKLALSVEALKVAEHDAILNLKRALRKHPLAPFQKRHKGIGEKQLARLLAVIGDPYWNDLHDRPRRVSDLWAYCGFHVIKTSGGHTTTEAQTFHAAGTQLHTGGQVGYETQMTTAPGVAPRRQRGQQSNWSEPARIRVWVIASAMPKFPGGHYEKVYRQAREKYAEATHPVDCIRCGPSGKPALAGTPLSPGHQHARAVRIVAKEILKDLWIEARSLYYPEEKAVDAQV